MSLTLVPRDTDRPPDQMKASEQAAGMPHGLWTEPWSPCGGFCTLPKAEPLEPCSSSLWAELKCCPGERTTPRGCPPLPLFPFMPSVEDAGGNPPLSGQQGDIALGWVEKALTGPRRAWTLASCWDRDKKGLAVPLSLGSSIFPTRNALQGLSWEGASPSQPLPVHLFPAPEEEAQREKGGGGTFQLPLGHIPVACLGRKGHLSVPASTVGQFQTLTRALT